MTPELQAAVGPASRPAGDALSRPIEAEQPKKRRRAIVFLTLAILAVAAIVGWRRFAVSASPQGVIVLSGRIEGDESAVAPKLGGRILEVRVQRRGHGQG